MAAGDGPLLEPSDAVVPNVGIGGTVCEIVEGGIERNEAVAALAKQVENITQVFSFQIVAVKKDDLRRFVAEKFVGELFVVIENGIGILEERGHILLLQRGVAGAKGGVVDWSESPIFGVERDGSDAVAAIGKERFEFLARPDITADVEERMAEVAHFLAALG